MIIRVFAQCFFQCFHICVCEFRGLILHTAKQHYSWQMHGHCVFVCARVSTLTGVPHSAAEHQGL